MYLKITVLTFLLHKRVINEFKNIKSPYAIHEYILKLFKNLNKKDYLYIFLTFFLITLQVL